MNAVHGGPTKMRWSAFVCNSVCGSAEVIEIGQYLTDLWSIPFYLRWPRRDFFYDCSVDTHLK